MSKLFATERQTKIMEHLLSKNRLTVKELSEKMGVSGATLRLDLRKMEEEGLLLRTHGGAVLKETDQDNDTSFSNRVITNVVAKSAIAKKAYTIIKPNTSILLDASSTCLELAKLLKETSMKLTVVTSGIYTAFEMIENPRITTILIGGIVGKSGSTIEGTFGVSMLDHININYFFTSSNGFSFQNGLTDFNIYEVELKKEMVKKAEKIVALVDQSKMNHTSISSFASLEQIDTFISDYQPTEDWINKIQSKGIEYIKS
ncbi:DeoR/GlpR family DNA-binding transcription regulator [Shouchella patagoniensis]|uniref:DeoR/GlpR family DNA-binding transcription regulator n=1 Tax=Shouchella patagoniensis TaxID=228576 RepID=UPI0009957EFF|nr:DeoR/GlpR family DNA-binding transcription regulator [Shouchella patagoniensis]